MSQQKAIIAAAEEAFDVIRELGSPRDAAKALSITHAKLCLLGGGDTPEKIKTMMDEMTVGVIENCMILKEFNS